MHQLKKCARSKARHSVDYLHSRTFAERLEPRILLASTIQILANDFEFEAGQPFSVLGRLVSQGGQPVAGVNINADDGLLLTSHSCGTTTSQGYFTLEYTASQTQQAGAGLFAVKLSSADGAATGIVLDATEAAAPAYGIDNLSLTYGSAPSAPAPANGAVPDSSTGGAFDWLNSATKVFMQKSADAVDVAWSDYKTVSDDYVLPAMDQWMNDLGNDLLQKTADQQVTTWGAVSAASSVASFALEPWTIPQEVIKVSADSIVTSLTGLNVISPSTASTAHSIIDGLDGELSLAEGFAIGPEGTMSTAAKAVDLVSSLVNDANAGLEAVQASFQLLDDSQGNPFEVKIAIAPTNPSTGAADGGIAYCIRLANTAPTAPTPQITYVTPNLPGEPVPQRQQIIIRGSGFLPNSLLEFNDGTTTYTDRIPDYVTKGSAGQPDEIGYNIAVGNDTANWTVTVVNGDQRSAAFPFTVTAQPDDAAPAAPISIDASYVGGTDQNLYAVNWIDPDDSSGIAKVWYKLGSPPASPSDGLSLDIDQAQPLFINSPSSDQELYVWLEDGAGNKDQTHAATVVLNANPSLPSADHLFLGQQFAVGSDPECVTTGDFNGDGIADLATANYGNVSVLLGNGDGTFATAVSYAVGSYPESVTTGDFNGDGITDLATANSGSNTVSVLLGHGDGTFAPAVSYGVGSFPYSVTTGDFNGDGKTDLAIANEYSNSVSILLGHGDGTFATAVSYAVGSSPYSVTTGDFNGDGKSDLAIANYRSNSVSMLLGHGDGTFAPAASYAVGSNPESITTGDFNGDGKTDLVTANYYNVSVLLGHGNGTFSSAVNYGAGSEPYSVTTGDLNGDGKTDLAVANWGSNTVSVLLGHGDGTFAAAVSYGVGPYPTSVTTGDFNGDGKTDLAIANGDSNTVSVLLGNGDGTFATAASDVVGSKPYSVSSGDFNGDGKTDLATVNSGNNTVSVLLGNGDGTFAAAVNYGVGSKPYSVATGDFNGDGKTDLATVNSGSNTVSVLLGNGDGTFAAALNYGVGSQPYSVTTGDFNGDGKTDLVVANYGSDNVSVLLGNGDGTFATALSYSVGSYPESVTTGDFNGDGKTDLAIANYGSDNVSVLLGHGDGTFGTALSYSVGSYPPSSVTTGDFNRDGKADLAIANDVNVSVLLGNGDGTFSAAVNYRVGLWAYCVTTGDFNGDGITDLATANSGSDNVSVLLGNGDGTFAAAVSYGAGSQPYSITTGDFNGDGKTDLATANYGSNNVSVLLNQRQGDAIPPTIKASAFDPTSDASMQLTFSEGLSSLAIAQSTLEITNLSTNQTYKAADATVSDDNSVLTFALPTNLPDGNYRFELPAGSVADVAGNMLAANYDMQGSSDFILAGDANHDRTVNALDFNALATNYGKPGTFSQGDFDYSGTIDSNDFAILASRYGTVLAPPAGSAQPAAEALATSLTSSSVNLFADKPLRSMEVDADLLT